MKAIHIPSILILAIASLPGVVAQTPQPQPQAQVQAAVTDKPTCIPVGSPKSPIKGTHIPKKLGSIWEKARKKISDQTGVDLGSAQDIKDSLTPPPCPVVPAAPAAQVIPVISK